MAHQQTYNRKGDKSFLDWIAQVEKVANLNCWSELQLARTKAGGIVYKLIERLPKFSTWEAIKKRLCQVFSPIPTKMHAATRVHSRPQAAN